MRKRDQVHMRSEADCKKEVSRETLGAPRRSRFLGPIAIAVFLVVLVLGLGYGARGARGEGGLSEGETGVPTARQTKEALESPTGVLEEAPETDSRAADELPHRNLERGEALELAEAVFSPELESAAGIYGELEPEKFLSNYAAVVPSSGLPEPPGQEIGEPQTSLPPKQPVLVESTLPLRTESADGETEAVDLGLQRSEGELKPENPLTEVSVPAQLGEGVSLPGAEVEIEVGGAPEDRAPSNVDGHYGFYPNVAENTDLIVAPTPTGVEVMTDIRSAEAPLSTTYDLGLPEGAALKEGEDGSAEVVQDGRTTVVIPPPNAIDAAGNSVPVEMQVGEGQLEVKVSPEAGATFPILVDPTYIVEGWHWTLQHDSLAAWSPSSSTMGYVTFPYEAWNPTYYPGLDVSSGWANAPSGSHADWSYWVPRYHQDLGRFGAPPSTWIWQMYTEGVLFLPWGNTSNYPALVLGLTDPNYGWAVSGVHYGGQGEMDNWNNNFTFTNEYEQTGTKGADMNLVTYENEQPAKQRDTYIAYATIAVADTDAPKILELNPPEHWATGSRATIPYAFEDAGLGVRSAGLKPAGAESFSWAVDFNCTGTTASPCPRVASSTEAGRPEFAYAPNQLPTGRDKLEVTVGDPLWTTGHTATGTVVVKVDNTAPELSLSGSLTEQGSLGTHRPTYALRVNAKDGSEGAPQSGIAKVEVKVDGKKIAMPDETEWAPNCQTQNCPLASEWGLNAAEFSAGAHEVEVIATDAVGNSTVKKLSIELHPPAPSLTVSGSITEQATLGTSRPQYKLKLNASSLVESPVPASLPSFVASSGSAGTSCGQYSHPADIAIDPNGNMWVVDTGNNRVEEFLRGTGECKIVGSAGSGNGQFNRPTAIATDANGHVWVADSGNKRIEEFNLNREYLGEFGSAGTGNGQFGGSGPEGIAVDYHGNIWVSDTYGGRLEEFSEAGVFKRSVATRGLGVGQLLEPSGIDIGPGGNVWVTDWGKNKVVEFTGTGQLVREFGSEGSGNGEFRHPDGISIDSKGDVFVGDQNNERVQEFNQGGEFIGKFGSSGSGSGKFNLGYPIGITTEANGNILVTDTGNNRIELWSSANYATAGQPTYISSFGSAGTTAGHFSQVLGLAVDASGNVWTADATNNLLQKFNSKGELLAAYGTPGSGNGQLSAPTALTANAGHIWDAEMLNGRVQEFNESGGYLAKFGSLGSAAGQLEYPWGLAFDNNHHIWVTETGAKAVQEFNESGTVIKVLGPKGSGNGQFNGATGIAVGPGGKLWVVDTGNNRVEEFSESGIFLRQFGGSESEVGHLISPMGIYVDPNEHVWVADRGHDRVVEFNGAGEYITQFGSAGSGPGQFNPPEDITGDSSGHLFVSDGGNNRVEEWSRPALHSQVSTEITVDGKRVDAAEASCEAETCPTQREWILESSTLAPGVHTVAVKATDGYGNTTTKTINFEIARDTTKPALEVGGELASAPAGWIEQETYGIHASATDSGYGVASLAFKIDGQTVISTTQACQQGACPASISKSVNMSQYEGGAHEAEVVATDGAGNATVKRWTINVDPEGHISTSEAEATLEALEETSPANLIGPPEEQEEYVGTSLGLGVEQKEGALITTGSNVPVEIAENPSAGFTMEVASEATLASPCEVVHEEEEVHSEPSETVEEEPGVTENSYCLPLPVLEELVATEEQKVAEGLKEPGKEAITITPLATGSEAGAVEPAEGNAAVAPNTGPDADTVIRPLADGGMSFAEIRDAAAPIHYAFEMHLSPELGLMLLDSQHAEVYYKEGGFPAFTIEAEAAHDAIGTVVPTHLEVSGNVLTLTVEHRNPSPAGGSFVYPVIGGAGWQGGYRMISVELAEPPPPDEEGSGEVGSAEEFVISAPEPSTPQQAGITESAMISRAKNNTSRQPYRWIRCAPFPEYDVEAKASYGTGKFDCGNPFTRSSATNNVEFNFGLRGYFYFSPNNFVKHRGTATDEIECAKEDFPEHYEGRFLEPEYWIDPAQRCVWWGHTSGGGGDYETVRKHLTPYGEWNTGEGERGSWNIEQVGSALYIFATRSGFEINRHKTTCIDC